VALPPHPDLSEVEMSYTDVADHHRFRGAERDRSRQVAAATCL
jgi:hypothetical protein